jgi:Holliday junction resolvase RusA-like endonuclease
MKRVVVKIPVKPIAASRPRIPRYGKPYFLKTYKKWRDDADKAVKEWTKEPLDTAVRLTTLFAIPRARTSKLIVPAGDGDNFEKALFDMLVRKKYLLDDKWITSCTWLKRFLPYGEEGYGLVLIEEEPDDIDIRCTGKEAHAYLLGRRIILPRRTGRGRKG